MLSRNLIRALVICSLTIPAAAVMTACCGGGGSTTVTSDNTSSDDKKDKKDKKDDKKKDDKKKDAKTHFTKEQVKEKFEAPFKKEGWAVKSFSNSSSGTNTIYTIYGTKDDKTATITIFDYPEEKERSKTHAREEKGKDTASKKKKNYVISVRIKGDKDAAKKLLKKLT